MQLAGVNQLGGQTNLLDGQMHTQLTCYYLLGYVEGEGKSNFMITFAIEN